MINFDGSWQRLFSGLLVLFLVCVGRVGFAQTNDLTAAWLGTVDQSGLAVNGLPGNGRVAQLLSGCRYTAGAAIKVVNGAGQTVPKTTVLTASLSIVITDAGGRPKATPCTPPARPCPCRPSTMPPVARRPASSTAF